MFYYERYIDNTFLLSIREKKNPFYCPLVALEWNKQTLLQFCISQIQAVSPPYKFKPKFKPKLDF
jgi:hypothetical protein